ncbi:hypothetical protein PFNF135_00024 [Plasmodium falciparum NF135/5.C10]|uniref:Uncharacterized protein n=1 Tax=Plasmodium falciparum NF135/5.C10 TaxID=1036726 RepID=W4IQ01_PLAFA|nr:hypothetical protein PFNF135_00024 [Plasmodium falciparum NF135/5.C10]
MSVIIFKYEMNLLKNDNKILFYSYNLGLKIIIYSIKKISLGRGEKSQFYYVIKNNIKNIRDFWKNRKMDIFVFYDFFFNLNNIIDFFLSKYIIVLNKISPLSIILFYFSEYRYLDNCDIIYVV